MAAFSKRGERGGGSEGPARLPFGCAFDFTVPWTEEEVPRGARTLPCYDPRSHANTTRYSSQQQAAQLAVLLLQVAIVAAVPVPGHSGAAVFLGLAVCLNAMPPTPHKYPRKENTQQCVLLYYTTPRNKPASKMRARSRVRRGAHVRRNIPHIAPPCSARHSHGVAGALLSGFRFCGSNLGCPTQSFGRFAAKRDSRQPAPREVRRISRRP